MLNNLCESEIRQDNWAYAQEVCLEAFAANVKRPAEKVLPEVPPEDIAWGLFNYGVAWAQANSADSYFCPILKILDPPKSEDGPVKIELDPATVSEVYYQLGRLALQHNDYMDSEQFHRRARDIRVANLGALHELTGESLAALGHAQLCRGHFFEAENDARKALWIWQTLPEAWHLDLARGHLGIGLVFEGQGRLPEALNSYWQALYAIVLDLAASTSESFRQAIRRCAGGTQPDSPEQAFVAMKKCRHLSETQNRLTAVSLHAIGRVLLTFEPTEPQERFDILGLSFREATLGSLHPLVAQSHLAVGRAFESQGRLDDARSHYRRASGIAESTLGPGHRVVGLSLYNLARVMRLQGQAEDAERYFKRAVAIIQSGIPPGSIPDEEYIRKLQMRVERDYALDELQGPEVRTTIARDSPRLPRDHQTLNELFEKKKADFLAMLKPGQKPGDVFKKFINMIDDPVDDLKHEVHGMVLFGRRIFWPEGFMQGAGDPCK
jgi:tetratricopeptide (TPR) repeat protein